MAEKATMGVVLQMVQQNDEKHEAGHKRLRDDWREMEKRVTALERAYTDHELHFGRVDAQNKAPIDVGTIVFNPKMVLGILAFLATVLTGNYWTTTSAVAVLRAEFASVKEIVDDLKRQMEMRRLEIQQINNNMQQMQRSQK